jgi:two-component system, LytTR family, response regulator
MMEKIRTLIVDDEPLARRGLELRLATQDDVSIIGQCANGREALEASAEHGPDLILLDVQMPGMDGFQVLERLHSQHGDDLPCVIFVTAFDEYAVRAFEAHALDYLLKPVEDARLVDALSRVRDARDVKVLGEQRQRMLALLEELTGEQADEVEARISDPEGGRWLQTLTIRDGRRIHRVPTRQISYIEAAGDYMAVHAEGQTHILRQTMKALIEQLNPQRFQRIHRSTIINVEQVAKLDTHMNGEYFVELNDGTRLKLSRKFRDSLRVLI